jgi:hypothetical protein
LYLKKNNAAIDPNPNSQALNGARKKAGLAPPIWSIYKEEPRLIKEKMTNKNT